ncbi:MAG: oligosaccharide repeat unit polymerase [Merismopedia sp. SIO2A8]|nr:oligosaccharide repeat unit polymerase [Merismopedia sp. SIO2A8]
MTRSSNPHQNYPQKRSRQRFSRRFPPPPVGPTYGSAPAYPGNHAVPQALPPHVSMPPKPSTMGSACILIGIFVAYCLYPMGVTTDAMARAAAIPTGIALLASFAFDGTKGIRNLFRTDALCLLSLYGLTFAEFLFPQPDFERMATLEQVKVAIDIVLLGIGGLVVGRHLVKPRQMRSRWLTLGDISNKALFRVFLICTVFAYLYMLITVQFNLVWMVEAMLAPRFSQPWTRAALGGWSSFITELQLLAYVIPPLTGVIWNRRQSFSKIQLAIVLLIFSFTLFSGFAGGTRNTFVAYMTTFLTAYLLTLPRNTIRNTLIPAILISLLTVFATYHMLELRTVGLKRYITEEIYASETVRDTFAVDYNLASISWVADAMPQTYDFLGAEVLQWAIVKPIPRALWPGKPVGLSVTIEEIAGAKGWTVAVTYLGECYMMAGFVGVALISVGLGAMAAWWNRMAALSQSDYGLLVYALGFFAAAITMRSLFWLTTAMLPVLALIAFKKFKVVR